MPDAALPDGLVLAFYGDDFTGSSAVLEVLTFAGLPTVLFLDVPTPERLARFAGRRAVGIAGVAGLSLRRTDKGDPVAVGKRVTYQVEVSNTGSAPAADVEVRVILPPELRPVVEGRVKSAFAMTEPAPGGGSDPGMIRTRAEKKNGKWLISGRKWFITGAGEAAHFIVIARTSDDKRRGLTAFLFHRDQPGWRIVRRIPIMGPEEHGGHCELEFDGLEVADENVLLGIGNGLKATQIRLGPARLTHCMRWLGWSKRCLEIAQDYVNKREGFGVKLADSESVQIKLGQVAQRIQIGRLLTMHAAWKLDHGDRARKEISMAKVHVADTLHEAADTAIQLNGARGYSKDTILEWIYRAARAAQPGRKELRKINGVTGVHPEREETEHRKGHQQPAKG